MPSEYNYCPLTGDLLIVFRNARGPATLGDFVGGFLSPKRIAELPLPRDVLLAFREKVVANIVERVATFLHRKRHGPLLVLANRVELECLAFEAETIQIARSADRVYRTAVEVELEAYLRTGKETNNVRFLPHLRPSPDQGGLPKGRDGRGLSGPAQRLPVGGDRPPEI